MLKLNYTENGFERKIFRNFRDNYFEGICNVSFYTGKNQHIYMPINFVISDILSIYLFQYLNY